MLRKLAGAPAVALLAVLTFALLFTFRTLDDNRLTSWQWVFSVASGPLMYLLIAAGIGGAYLLSHRAAGGMTNAPALLFSVSFLISTIFWGEPELIVDASRYFVQAKYLETYGIVFFFKEWGKTIPAWTDLPLVPLLYGLLFKYAGEARIVVQLFTTTLFSATTVVTYLIGRMLWDEDTGWVGGGLLLGVPYLLTQVPLMLVDVPTMFFSVLAAYTFIRVLARGGTIRVLLASLCSGLALFSKYSSWPLLAIVFVSAVLAFHLGQPRPRDQGFMYVRRGLSVVALMIIMAIPVIGLKYRVFAEQIRFLMEYQGPGLGRWEESYLSTFMFQTHPFITIAAAVSLFVAIRRRDTAYLMISSCVLVAVLFQVKRIRYLIPLFPLVTLMASYAIRQVQERSLRRFIVFSVIGSSVMVAMFGYLPFVSRMSTANLADAGRYLDTLAEEDVEVLVVARDTAVVNQAVSVPLLDLFTKKHVIYRYEPPPFPAHDTLRTSPLRFSWEYRNPLYYSEASYTLAARRAMVIITDDLQGPAPPNIASRLEGYHPFATFGIDEGVFQFKTFVAIYRSG